jgi:hypothetical protein
MTIQKKEPMPQALLEHRLNELQEQIEEGFRGVHERQDITNGKVQKNTEWRIYITGAMAVLMTFVVPLIFIIVKQYIERII